jgi:hypothetical protein
MFIGHFAVAAATKPAAPKLPIWMLFVASQLLDIVFIPLVALGIESITPSTYGQGVIQAYYTHSLVGALLISAGAYWLGVYFWKSAQSGWILAALTFSHWVIDLFVHHQDMPLLPGNLGGLPLLGFGLWDYTWPIFILELLMALAGVVIYTLWSQRNAKPGTRWYIGPIVVAILFLLFIAIDHPQFMGL